MGAKLSRRKSECAAAAEGVAAEIAATEEPETAEAVAVIESNEEKTDEGDDVTQPKATKMAPSEPDPRPVGTITQAVEDIMSNVSEQIAGPVEDIVNKGITAVEAMMAAVSVKDVPTEPPAGVPNKEPSPEPLVDLSEEAKAKIDVSILEPPEDPANLPSDSSGLEDLLLSQSITQGLLPESAPAEKADDIPSLAVEDEADPIQIDAKAPSEEPLVCMKEYTASAEEPLNCEVGADSTTLNSDPLVALGVMEQAESMDVNTAMDLI